MINKWNRKNALWMLLYAVLYAIVTAVVCVTGSIHPIFFVCYQITAGLLLSPIVIRAFRRVQAPGAAVCLFLGMLLLLLIIRDAVMWHVVPLIVIAVLAEFVRGMTNYSWSGDVAGTVLMSFSSFGYYGQIWFNRVYTYDLADAGKICEAETELSVILSRSTTDMVPMGSCISFNSIAHW